MEFDRLESTGGKPPDQLDQHFQGNARIQRLALPSPSQQELFAVHFDAGGRTRPHVHRRGQVLMVTSGHGVVGGTDGRRLVEAGDVVIVQPGEWHWHGATPFSAMTHVTLQASDPGDIDWEVDEGDWGGDCPA